jgi:ABC-type transport system involved in cytochrome c biogenesis permease subunit
MAPQVWFWLFFVIALICTLIVHVAYDPARPYFRWTVGAIFFFVLIGILGYQVFGSAVK